MPKMKINLGTPSAPNWVVMDANNGESVDGIHFRVNSGRLQYSTNNTNWSNAGTDTSDATAVAGNIISGKTAYVNGVKVAGTMPNYSGSEIIGEYATADPDIGVAPHSTGGDYLEVYTKPRSNGYMDGNTIIKTWIKGLTAAKVQTGVSFGVEGGKKLTGTYTSDANATASQILSGRTAYVNGVKVTGTMTNRSTGNHNADGISHVDTTLRFSVPGDAFYGNGATIQRNEPNWLTANIKKGVTMFGKTGTLEPLESGAKIPVSSVSNEEYVIEKYYAKNAYGLNQSAVVLGIDDEKLYVSTSTGGSADRNITAYDHRTGNIVWTRNVGDTTQSAKTALFRNGKLYVLQHGSLDSSQSGRSAVRCINLNTGIIEWSYYTKTGNGACHVHSFDVNDNRVVLNMYNQVGSNYATHRTTMLNAQNGSIIYEDVQYGTDQSHIYSWGVALDNSNNVYVLGDRSSNTGEWRRLIRLSGTTGAYSAQSSVEETYYAQDIIFSNGYIFINRSGTLIRFTTGLVKDAEFSRPSDVDYVNMPILNFPRNGFGASEALLATGRYGFYLISTNGVYKKTKLPYYYNFRTFVSPSGKTIFAHSETYSEVYYNNEATYFLLRKEFTII